MFNEKYRSEIQKCQKYPPMRFRFHIKMKVNRVGVVVGDDESVLQCTVKDIPYLGQRESR